MTSNSSSPPASNQPVRQRVAGLVGRLFARFRRQKKIAPPPPQIRVIVNPASGQDRPFLKTFNAIFRQAGYDWDMVVTKQAGDGKRLAQAAVSAGVKTVVAYGGDGTIMEVACGLIGSGVPLGIIPGGTGNVMSVELGIPKDIAAAAEVIINPQHQIKVLDMGQIGDQCFMLRASLGLEADMVERADRDLKDRYGILSYAVAMLQALREPEMATYRVTIDGETYEHQGITCIVANTGNLGVVGLSLAPDVDVSDGLLDVFIVTRADLPGIFSLAADVLGGAAEPANLLHWRGTDILVESDPPQVIQCDGELLGNSPLAVSALPAAVQVITPPAVPLPPENLPE